MTENNPADIDKTDYAGNSNKKKKAAPREFVAEAVEGVPQEPKKVAPVVEGRVIRKKTSWWKKFGNAVTADETRGVGMYVLEEILIPAFKSMVYEAITGGTERAIFGEVRGRALGSSAFRGGGTNYSKISTGRVNRGLEEPRNRTISSRSRKAHNFDEIILESRVEAQEVLERLSDLVEQYGTATVADLFDLVDLDTNFVDAKWGWDNLSTARSVKVRGGYFLDLPRPEPLD